MKLCTLRLIKGKEDVQFPYMQGVIISSFEYDQKGGIYNTY